MAGVTGKTPLVIIDENILYQELEGCHCFKYIAFKETRMPFRHTGFLLFFDNVPKYTINVRTAEDSWAHWLQSLLIAPGRITVESAADLAPVRYVGRPVVHVINNDREREAARNDLVTLLTPKRSYALLWQNCRDHVQNISSRLDDRHPGVGDAARQDLRQVLTEDWLLISLLIALVSVPIAIAFKR